jgi:hypothetical protein
VLYGHLSEVSVMNGQVLDNADTFIGKTGQSGGATYPHLHFELRLGKRCSMEYQLQNPGSANDCRPPPGLEFDPHIDPMMLYAPPPAERSLSCPDQDYRNGDVVVTWSAGNRTDILLDYAEVTVKDSMGGVLATHTLGENLRTGFNATSEALLDQRNTAVPYPSPLHYGVTAMVYQSSVTIPSAWLNSWPQRAEIEVVMGDGWYRPSDSTTFQSCEIPVIPQALAAL